MAVISMIFHLQEWFGYQNTRKRSLFQNIPLTQNRPFRVKTPFDNFCHICKLTVYSLLGHFWALVWLPLRTSRPPEEIQGWPRKGRGLPNFASPIPDMTSSRSLPWRSYVICRLRWAGQLGSPSRDETSFFLQRCPCLWHCWVHPYSGLLHI